jgi:hypothetical protein
MNHIRTRATLAIGLPVLSLALAVAAFFVTRGDLPERLATHFDGSGAPDDSMTLAAFTATTTVLGGIGVLLLVAVALWRTPLSGMANSTLGFLGGFLAGLGSGIYAATLISQRGNAGWEDASSVWAVVASSVLLALIFGVIGVRLAALLPMTQPSIDPAVDQPRMDLQPGQRAVWSERLHSRVLSSVGIATVCIGIVVGLATQWWVVIPCLLGGLALLSLAILNVRADDSGLHVRYGVLPWPSTDIGVERIETASVIDVRPMQWGGWGYRGSLKLMKQAAVVHRAGPGIRLDLTDGKVFVVTVDNPENAVALLNAHAQQPHVL